MTRRSKWLRLLAIIGVAVIGLAACDSDDTAEDQTVDAQADDEATDDGADDAEGADEAADDTEGDDDPYGSSDDDDSGAEDTEEEDDGAAATAGGALEIEGFAFGDVAAAPGATVKIENKDSTTHTVTADNDEFDAGEIDGGGSAEITAPDEPGEYAFHCEIHTSMKGTLVVA